MPERLLVSARVANAAIEKNVWEMQIVVRSLDACIEWVYSTTSDPDDAMLVWTAEIVGRVIGRSQSGASEEWTTCERRNRTNCRKALVQCNELVMLTMIEKPKDKGGTQNCISIMSDLVDRSDEVVVGGTTERVVKARIVCLLLEEQRRDARDAQSTRGVPWQQTSAETVGGEVGERSPCCECSIDRDGRGAGRIQSSLVLW